MKLNCSNAAVLAHVPTRCDLKKITEDKVKTKLMSIYFVMSFI